MFLFTHGAGLPMHNHPDMYVWSKVVLGRATLDRIDVSRNELQGERVVEILNESSGVSFLGPDCWNLHSIQADSPVTVMLDVMVPPYGAKKCNFYEITQAPDCTAKVLLEQASEPKIDWKVCKYLGSLKFAIKLQEIIRKAQEES